MQTRYLLDTCTLVAMLKDEYGIRNKIREVGAEQCFVSEASVAELFYGAYNSANPLRHLQEVSFVISHFVVIPTSVALELWGKNKAFLRKKGLLIDDFDILIGSTAIAEKMTLVTDNVKHLSRLPDVEIENWLSRFKMYDYDKNERVPQGRSQEEASGHSLLEEASDVARRVLESIQAVAGTTACKGIQMHALHKYAVEHGLMIDTSTLGTFVDRGSENPNS